MALKSLYISYFGVLKHLSQTQILPYLRGLAADGVSVTIVSFEERWPDPRTEAAARHTLDLELRRCGISWVPLRYHKRPSLPATAWDVAVACLVSLYLVIRRRVDVVHARGHVPAVPGLLLKLALRRKLIFDLRGTMAEEYADAGVWRRGSLPYGIAKAVERAALHHADAVIMLTARIRNQFAAQLSRAVMARVEVIPCCVDLSLYGPGDKQRALDKLGFGDRRLMAYVGNLGGCYLTEEMMRLFLTAREIDSRMHFLILTQAPSVATRALLRTGVDGAHVTVRTVHPGEVSGYLQAADFGLSFIEAAPSKMSSSPTKVGEYLACGLPILANRGIGDVDELIERHGVGVLINGFKEHEYSAAINSMLALIEEDPDVGRRCRRAAEEELSLGGIGMPRYLRVYRRVGHTRQCAKET